MTHGKVLIKADSSIVVNESGSTRTKKCGSEKEEKQRYEDPEKS
jgi:hypothetical protein